MKTVFSSPQQRLTAFGGETVKLMTILNCNQINSKCGKSFVLTNDVIDLTLINAIFVVIMRQINYVTMKYKKL